MSFFIRNFQRISTKRSRYINFIKFNYCHLFIHIFNTLKPKGEILFILQRVCNTYVNETYTFDIPQV